MHSASFVQFVVIFEDLVEYSYLSLILPHGSSTHTHTHTHNTTRLLHQATPWPHTHSPNRSHTHRTDPTARHCTAANDSRIKKLTTV
ncbi:hypothetical protein RIF29_14302 [Crotalaria pallida]|uniref:Uncharacterized protein n=1 Tax=Crotalaria pallida TaxID=3830 RepID=A0AAN9FHA8_CROPI